MTLKQRIWLLPAIAALASMLSIGINYVLSQSASSVLATAGSQDYAAVNSASVLLATVTSLEDALKYAVSSGDKDGLATLEQKAAAFRQITDELSTLPGKRQSATQLQQEFEGYFRAASESAAIMLNVRQGKQRGDMPSAFGLEAVGAEFIDAVDEL